MTNDELPGAGSAQPCIASAMVLSRRIAKSVKRV